MNNEPLFDEKKKGLGVDRMGDKKDGLILKWMWGSKYYGWKPEDALIPQQNCTTSFGDYTLTVTSWHSNYEVDLEEIDSSLGYNAFTKAGIDIEKIYTRLDGQILAEKLFLIFHKNNERLIKKYFNGKEKEHLKDDWCNKIRMIIRETEGTDLTEQMLDKTMILVNKRINNLINSAKIEERERIIKGLKEDFFNLPINDFLK